MALILSRKLGESIQIGDDIVITIAEIDRGKIRLAITAPRDVAILRTELLPQRGSGSCTNSATTPSKS